MEYACWWKFISIKMRMRAKFGGIRLFIMHRKKCICVCNSTKGSICTCVCVCVSERERDGGAFLSGLVLSETD